MNKKDLIRTISEETGYTQKNITPIVESALEVIINTVVAGEEVALTNFGKFDLRTRAAKTVKNPRTGESMMVGETKGVHFTPSTSVKERANAND